MYVNISGLVKTAKPAKQSILKSTLNILRGKNIDAAKDRLAAFRKANAERLAKDSKRITGSFGDHMYRGEELAHKAITKEKAKTAVGIAGLTTGVGYTGYKGHKYLQEQKQKQAAVDENIPRDTRPPASNQPADGPDYYDWQEYMAQEGGINTPDRDNHPTLDTTKVANELQLDASTRAHISGFEKLSFEVLNNLQSEVGSRLLGASIANKNTKKPSIKQQVLDYIRRPPYME